MYMTQIMKTEAPIYLTGERNNNHLVTSGIKILKIKGSTTITESFHDPFIGSAPTLNPSYKSGKAVLMLL